MGNITDFHEQHGEHFIQIDGWLLWPNGASRENSRYGILKNPPENLHQRAKLQKRYWEVKTKRAVAVFDRWKKELQMRGGTDDEVKQLEALAAEAKACQAELRKAMEAVKDTQGWREGDTLESLRERNRLKEHCRAIAEKDRQAFRERVDKIKI